MSGGGERLAASRLQIPDSGFQIGGPGDVSARVQDRPRRPDSNRRLSLISAMRKRAAQKPADEVVVYCVSCMKAMSLGGRKPRYLVDLLFGEDTVPGTLDPDTWHAELDNYVARHA
jgi:hypothetical protein